jgi:hypothetical protein
MGSPVNPTPKRYRFNFRTSVVYRNTALAPLHFKL